MEKILSIITVVKNNKIGLQRLFEKLREEKQAWVEYVVIDGLSSDGSKELVESSSDIIDRLVTEDDRGIYDAMNKGARFSTGRYIWFINSDDYPAPGAINRIGEELFKDCEQPAGILYGDYVSVEKKSGLRRRHVGDFSRIKWRMPAGHCSIIMHRSLLESFPFNEKFKIAADYDQIQRVMRDGKVVTKKIDKVMAIFEEGGVSSRNNYSREVFISQLENGRVIFALLSYVRNQAAFSLKGFAGIFRKILSILLI